MYRANSNKWASVSQSIIANYKEHTIKHEIIWHNSLTHEYRKEIYDNFKTACILFENYSQCVDVIGKAKENQTEGN